MRLKTAESVNLPINSNQTSDPMVSD